LNYPSWGTFAAANWRETEFVTSAVRPPGCMAYSRGRAPAAITPARAGRPARAAPESITVEVGLVCLAGLAVLRAVGWSP
jgi:hypothetical protein